MAKTTTASLAGSGTAPIAPGVRFTFGSNRARCRPAWGVTLERLVAGRGLGCHEFVFRRGAP
jgi:hypothetical protein